MTKGLATFLLPLLLILVAPPPTSAAPPATGNQVAPPARTVGPAANAPPLEPKGYVLLPSLSFLLPGLGQYWDGATPEGLAYSGVWLAGGLLASHAATQVAAYQDSASYQGLSEVDQENYLVHADPPRRFALGTQLSLAAGSFSAYSSFYERSRYERRHGALTMMTAPSPLSEILAAPLRFHYLTSFNTYLPLALVTGIFALNSVTKDEHYATDPITTGDIGYASAYSYLAGTHEEALFRGFLLPTLVASMESPALGNLTTSALFAAAHLGTVDLPIVQMLLGWHLGQTVMASGYNLQEAIFIHTWWDVIAFLDAYRYKQQNPESRVTPRLTLPPLLWAF